MKFKGDIIITDPCYIVKDREENPHAYPSIDDPNYRTLLDAYKTWNKEHDDWEKCDYGANMEILGFTTFISESTIYGDWSCTTWDLKNKDPKEFIDNLCKSYQEADRIKGLYGKLSKNYKDTLEEMDSKFTTLESLGDFCADSGQVGVFLLDEVLKYNPDFDYDLNKPWTTTLIKDFDGDIEYYIDKDTEAHIIGIGNINFCTTQTEF